VLRRQEICFIVLEISVLQIDMQLKYLYPKLFLLLAFIAILSACGGSRKKNNLPTPAGYNLNDPQESKLPDKLNEISGLAYYPKDSGLFAVIDEAGVLYKLFRKKKVEVQNWKFAKSGDYEDIVLLDSIFYVIKSKGDIVAFHFQTPDSIKSEEFNIPVEGENEFEILYYDPAIAKLVMICKNCEADDKSIVSSWFFDPQTKSFSQGYITLDAPSILSQLKGDEKKFKPSAAAINPVTDELYIISSINKALVIANRDGKIKKVYQLDPKLFKQPEGITFSPSGDMYITNESAGEGLPNLLFFKYKKVAHEK
jgi:uncharacterized protein YjiK